MPNPQQPQPGKNNPEVEMPQVPKRNLPPVEADRQVSPTGPVTTERRADDDRLGREIEANQQPNKALSDETDEDSEDTQRH